MQSYKILVVDDEEHIRKILKFKLEKHGYVVITAENGEILARAQAEGDSLTVVDVDPERAASKQVTERNDLFADRRTELYRWQ